MDVVKNYQIKSTEESAIAPWKIEDVSAWVQRLGSQRSWHEDYPTNFTDHGIDGKCLQELTSELLKEIGVFKVGHRLVFLREIKELVKGNGMGESLQKPTTTALPVKTDKKGYTMQTTSHQLPVYMPQSQHNNYDVNYFVNAPEDVPNNHGIQTKLPVQPIVDNQMFYKHETLPADQPQYAEAGIPAQAETTQEKVHQPEQLEVCNAHEETGQPMEYVEPPQQHMYNLNISDEDSFPNAETLEPPHSMPMEPVSMKSSPPEHLEQQQAPYSEDDKSVVTGTPSEQQEALEEDIPSMEPVLEHQQQVRPSAWGSRSKLRIAPNATSTASKLLVQTMPVANRFNRNSREQLQPKKSVNGHQPDLGSRPPETDDVNAMAFYSAPVPGDILKGTVIKVVPALGAFIDINSSEDALLTNKEGVHNLRLEQNQSNWVMVKKVDESRIHLTSFLPGLHVQGTISHQFPTTGTPTGLFINVGWYKPGLLLLRRMKDRGRKKNQQLNLFVLKHSLKVIRNQQQIAELDLTEIRPEEWKPEDVFIWAQSFYGPEEQTPEGLGQLSGKDLFSLTAQTLEQLGVTDSNKQERILLCAKMMAEQRVLVTQRLAKQQATDKRSWQQTQPKRKIPPLPVGDSHFPALGNRKGRR